MNYQLPIIEKFIIRYYPDVMDVYFTEQDVYLASSFELPEEENTERTERRPSLVL